MGIYTTRDDMKEFSKLYPVASDWLDKHRTSRLMEKLTALGRKRTIDQTIELAKLSATFVYSSQNFEDQFQDLFPLASDWLARREAERELEIRKQVPAKLQTEENIERIKFLTLNFDLEKAIQKLNLADILKIQDELDQFIQIDHFDIIIL